MHRFRLALIVLPILGLTLSLAGCKKEEPKPSRQAKKESTGGAGGGSGGAPAASGGALEAKAFTATVKGRITYNGDAPPVVEVGKVDKANIDKGCPAEVMKGGWYTDKSVDKKGVRYAVVFLRGANGMKMPKLDEARLKPADGKEFAEMHQPSCQFEPRVVVCGPAQKMKFFNDSKPGMSHDANLSGPGSFGKTLPAGGDTVYDIDASDSTPYKVSCNQHSAFMGGWVWKFKHPYAAVTNENGEFEIKNVPVPTNGKFDVMVWHEMIEGPGGMKKLKEIEPKEGATETVDAAIPK